MDEKLQYILKIKKLQDEVITLRTEMPSLYSKYFKKSQSNQLKRLLTVQLDIPVTELDTSYKNTVYNSNEIVQPKIKTEEIENECENIMKVLDFIK